MPTLLLLLAGPAAVASPVDLYGFGAPSIGRGGGGVALSDDAGSVFLNPAGLTRLGGGQLILGYTALRFRFEELPEVYWDTNRDGRLDALDEPLAPDLPAPAADGMIAALARPLGRRLAVGMAASLPRDRLFRLHTFEPSLPTWFLYENRPQRYALAGALAAELPGGLSLGAGLRMLPQVQIDASLGIDLTVSGASPDPRGAEDILSAEVAVNDITVDLVPDFAPSAGLIWHLGALSPALEGLRLAGTWRGPSGVPVDIGLDMQINTTAQDIGELEPTTAVVILQGGLELFDHYLPGQLQGGLSWETRDTLRLYGDLVYTRWSRFTLNLARLVEAELQASLMDLSEVAISDASVVGAEFRDTLGYRLGSELSLPRWDLPEGAGDLRLRLRGGLGYDPSPLLGQTADTTLLDADRLIIALGAGLSHREPFGWQGGDYRLDLFLQGQPLARGALSRSSEEPRAGYPVDGTPVPIGGDILAAGAQWRLDY